jgi:hypothetical protein
VQIAVRYRQSSEPGHTKFRSVTAEEHALLHTVLTVFSSLNHPTAISLVMGRSEADRLQTLAFTTRWRETAHFRVTPKSVITLITMLCNPPPCHQVVPHAGMRVSRRFFVTSSDILARLRTQKITVSPFIMPLERPFPRKHDM